MSDMPHDQPYLPADAGTAGPAPERARQISNHPDQGGVRDACETQEIDPRLTKG